MVGQPQRDGDLGKRLLTNQTGAKPRQPALVNPRKALVQQTRDNAIQDAIAQEFEALVVRAAMTTVRQGLTQKLRIGEGVPEPPRQDLRV
jgi:hypothetical protein